MNLLIFSSLGQPEGGSNSLSQDLVTILIWMFMEIYDFQPKAHLQAKPPLFTFRTAQTQTGRFPPFLWRRLTS